MSRFAEQPNSRTSDDVSRFLDSQCAGDVDPFFAVFSVLPFRSASRRLQRKPRVDKQRIVVASVDSRSVKFVVVGVLNA